MSLSRMEKIRQRNRKEEEEKNKDEKKPPNPHKWVVNEKPENPFTDNRMFRILWRKIKDSCPF